MNIDEYRLSKHVRDRLHERINPLDRDEMVIAYLWHCGRPAVKADFTNFHKHVIAGQEYRVGTHKGRDYMVVFDPKSQVFVTLWQK